MLMKKYNIKDEKIQAEVKNEKETENEKYKKLYEKAN